MRSDDVYTPFSQRTSLVAIPPQLKIGEVSRELRQLLDYAIAKEIDNASANGVDHRYFRGNWSTVATDLHVRFFKRPIGLFENSVHKFKQETETFVKRANIGPLFDLIEFFSRHPHCTNGFKAELTDAFVSSRAAYRLVDAQVVAIGTAEQASAFELAVSAAESSGAISARNHLLKSGMELRSGSWADSVRESIHAVEAIARRFEPSANTLGQALRALETKGHIHGSLKAAFEKLYGYTNDEGGIRHALLEDVSRVDEVDALFMLGACASFVSYLISRDSSRPASDHERPLQG